MKHMLNLDDFLKTNSLTFENKRQALSWVKRNLRPTKLLKIGPNYLVDEKEINILYNSYLLKQEELKKKKQKQARKMSALKKDRAT